VLEYNIKNAILANAVKLGKKYIEKKVPNEI
jgi:hypothetical protein